MAHLDINNQSNYYEKFTFLPTEAFAKYLNVISEYITQIQENIIISNLNYFKYVVEKGLETITHIFRLLLLHTKNLDLVVYNCKKTIYYFIEFVGQISGDSNDYLKLSTNDAILFVYKKTIYSINNRNIDISEQDKIFNNVIYLLTNLWLNLMKVSIEYNITETNLELTNSFIYLQDYNISLMNLSLKREINDYNSKLILLLNVNDYLNGILQSNKLIDLMELLTKKIDKHDFISDNIIENIQKNIDKLNILTNRRFINLITNTR